MSFVNGEYGLLSPLYLALVAVVSVVLVVLFRSARSRLRLCARLGLSAPPATPVMTATLTALLLVVALSRPYWGSDVATVTDSEDEVMFIVDVSRSMLAKDVPPSRMSLAKRKMEDIIDAFTARRVPQRYGITLFAGGSYVLCPSTSDIPVLKQFIDNISPEIVTSLGSQLTLGLKTALERLLPPGATQGAVRGKRLVLISDGEDDQLALDAAVQMVKAGGVRLDVLGVGTPTGSTIQLPSGALLKDDSGAVVHSKLNESSLEALAKAGSGVYVRATLTDDDVARIATRTTSLPSSSLVATSREIVTYREVGPLLCGVALVLLALLITRRRNVVLALPIAVFCSSGVLHAQSLQPTPAPELPLSAHPARDGYELYQDGKYQEAARAFEQALRSDPKNPRLKQGLASALFKTGRYEDALTQFRAITEGSSNGRQYFENAYNEGNTLLALKRYREAIDAYHRALDIKDDDQRALANLQIARTLLEEEKRRPTPTPTPTPSPGTPPTPPQQTPPASPTPDHNKSETPRESPQATPSASASNPPATATPQGGATQPPNTRQTPSGSPSPQASPASGSQGKDDTTPPTPNQATPTGAPQGEERQQQEPPERLKESKLGDDLQGTPNAASTPAAAETRPSPVPVGSPLAMKEAEAWLESLPESPLIITKERGRKASMGQTW